MQDFLREYFPELDDGKQEQLKELEAVFREWNEKINLVSRKDMEAFTLHHLVHSLAILKWVHFPPQSRILDVGTGGGLPGLPLAICFPESRFFLCDSITKKANAVRDMAERLHLGNVQVVNKRAENLESKWDFILGRAVTSLPRFLGWIRKNLRGGNRDGLPNGVFYWKGSLYQDELESLGLKPWAVYDIREKIPDPYFAEKYLVHLATAQLRDLKLPVEG